MGGWETGLTTKEYRTCLGNYGNVPSCLFSKNQDVKQLLKHHSAKKLRGQSSSSDSKAVRKSEMLSVLEFQGREEKMFKDKGSLRK